MITKDMHAYAISKWSQFQSPITELSKNSEGNPLVQSPVKLLNFDEICKTLFDPGKVPTSADGLDVSGKVVELVEFKSGFKQRITKHNFDPAQGRCPDPDIDRVCQYYWDIFFKHQDAKINELISSIRFKALESYVTLEKQVFPYCQDLAKPILLKFVVVIDVDEVDSMEDTYSELAEIDDAKDNSISAVKSSLRRLTNQRDANGNAYFYDCIEVLSVSDYLSRLKLIV